MNRRIVYLVLCALLMSVQSQAQTYDSLVWADEFNTEGRIDGTKWWHQTVLPYKGESWFNGEVQHYTNRTKNSHNADGKLHITALKESFTDQNVTKEYTSARLNSKFAFTYGRVEVRAKMPTGKGTWPAIWMLGRNINELGGYWHTVGYGKVGWPACGEIDIVEHWGHNQDYVASAIHTPSSHGATINKGGKVISGVSNNFHTYTVEWSPTKMVFSIDSQIHYTYEPQRRNDQTWPFDKPQYLLLNVAIESSIDSAFDSSTMEVDYVRVYQESQVASVKPLVSGIKVFPNPATNRVEVIQPFASAHVEISNLLGSRVAAQDITSERTSLGVEHLTSGVYVVKVTDIASHRQLQVKLVKR